MPTQVLIAMRRRSFRKVIASVALVAAIVGILWAGEHYTAALAVLAFLCFSLLVGGVVTFSTLEVQRVDNEFAMLHDPLTELPNRLLFHDRVHQAILGATRTGNRVAVLVLDVDRFKEINDALGHHSGDL